jgi:hypothetical protein
MARKLKVRTRKQSPRRKAAAPRKQPAAPRKRPAAPRKRVVVRRRGYARNPKGILGSPSVRIGAAVVVGAGLGAAVDSGMPRPTWLPQQVPYSALVGLVLCVLAAKFSKGKTRELAVAAGVGMIGAGAIRGISGAVAPMLPSTMTERLSLPRRRSMTLRALPGGQRTAMNTGGNATASTAMNLANAGIMR